MRTDTERKMSVIMLTSLVPTIRRAGRAALDIYAGEFAVSHKADCSPVTEADMAVDEIIVSALQKAYPAIPVVSEERVASLETAKGAHRFFLVDPIDGTKEFVAKTGEFTINVALIEGGTPVAGIVYAPALGRLFIADVGGRSEEFCEKGSQTPIKVRACDDDGDLVALASRFHDSSETREFLKKHAITSRVTAGSSLKFCVLAAGKADIYPRFGPTMEWDTAAGHAVLAAAGGDVVTLDNQPLTYGKPGYRNPEFIASSPQARARCLGAETGT